MKEASSQWFERQITKATSGVDGRCKIITKPTPITKSHSVSLATLFQFVTTTLVFVCVSSANALPIQFVHEGRGSGVIAGVPFPESDFVITATGDTDNIQNSSPSIGAIFINHDHASISIEGLGNFDFVTPTRTFLSMGSFGVVGFSRAGTDGLDLYNGPVSRDLSGWDMTVSIGPVSGVGEIMQWDSDPIHTSGGIIVLDDALLPDGGRFIATVVPEPTSCFLLAVLSLTLLRQRAQ